jgi:predicted RNA polymerase sigma factor
VAGRDARDTKNKIRDAAIPFRVPDPPEWSEHLSFVLDATNRFGLRADIFCT